LITLVVAGFIVAGELDESGASSIAGLGWLARLPAPHRLAWLGSPAGRPGGWLRRLAATPLEPVDLQLQRRAGRLSVF
jgi:hypothetical protein